jgi:hypothetical protein
VSSPFSFHLSYFRNSDMHSFMGMIKSLQLNR